MRSGTFDKRRPMKEQIVKMYIQALIDDLPPNVFADQVLSLFGVSGRKLFAVESGGDWADASVDYFINLTDRTGKEVYKEYEESGGYHGNGKKWFRQWAIEKGYMREPKDSELETFYDGL